MIFCKREKECDQKIIFTRDIDISYYVNFVLDDEFKVFGSHSAGLIPYEFLGVTLYWPAQPLDAAEDNVPGIIIHSSDDSIAPPLFANTLESQMIDAEHSPIQRIDLDDKGHSWDKSKNQEQWDFFIENSQEGFLINSAAF